MTTGLVALVLWSEILILVLVRFVHVVWSCCSIWEFTTPSVEPIVGMLKFCARREISRNFVAISLLELVKQGKDRQPVVTKQYGYFLARHIFSIMSMSSRCSSPQFLSLRSELGHFPSFQDDDVFLPVASLEFDHKNGSSTRYAIGRETFLLFIWK